MALPRDADIPLILSRIRPAAEWGWGGEDKADPANLVWRDGVQVLPTQGELETEWAAIITERTAADTAEATFESDMDLLTGTDPALLQTAQLGLLVKALCRQRGLLDSSERLRDYREWKQQ